MATAHAPDAFDRADHWAMFAHGQNEILAATRLKPAGRRKKRTDQVLIAAHWHDQDQRQGSENQADHVGFTSRARFRAACGSSFRSESISSSRVGIPTPRGIRIKSMPTGRSAFVK